MDFRPVNIIILLIDCKHTDLAVKAQQKQHDEEEDSPQCWQRHHRHSLRVGNEGQARTWKENKEGRGGRGGKLG